MAGHVDRFGSLTQIAEASGDLTAAVSRGYPHLAAVMAEVDKLDDKGVDTLSGVLLLVGYLRHRRIGDVHEMRHLEAAWRVGASDDCRGSESCSLRNGLDGVTP